MLNLHGSVLFKDSREKDVEQLLASAQFRTFKQNQFVYREGDNAKFFYIIDKGMVELSKNMGSCDLLIIGHIFPGGHFGETAILANSHHALNAKALTDTDLLCVDEIGFHSMLVASSTIQRQLCVALADRLRISFQNHANTLTWVRHNCKSSEKNLDASFYSMPGMLAESTIASQIMEAARQFSDNLGPVLLTGEAGTGRRMAAHEIHRASAYKNGPYTEVDIHNIGPGLLEGELFGCEQDGFVFAKMQNLGLFEQFRGGTIVLYNAENMEPDIQRQLALTIRNEAFTKVGVDSKIALLSRIILICKDTSLLQDGHNRLLPSLYSLVAKQHFRMSPLRDHRRDIPRLIQYYLKRYTVQYGKVINQVDDQAMGVFMNYDWPGNLPEIASVVQRAVMLGRSNRPLENQNLLGLPKSEGKWEFNLLRLKFIRAFFQSRFFPVVPKLLLGVAFVGILGVILFGSGEGEKNIGLTLSWVVGWPLLIFSFFFLARTWCSICVLSVPGWLAQLALKPQRSTPLFIKHYSGWIMTFFCIFLFWIEITWNAYDSPKITAGIVLSITLGSFVFSVFFKRRVWCRYLCPLGAINALFSMPSILELRANRHVCINRCTNHLCYKGDDVVGGCPMFRHPFLVDNNRDCILCGQCIKNCRLDSIHLNVRIAPQELWNQQAPRLEDSILVISLAAIFFPFVAVQKNPLFGENLSGIFQRIGLPYGYVWAASSILFLCILLFLAVYIGVSHIMARITGSSWSATTSLLGYGMIPLVLGAFMAAHLEIFVDGIWLLLVQLQDITGISGGYSLGGTMSSDAKFTLQFITITGGLLASLYASHRILKRLLVVQKYSPKMFMLPGLLLGLSALAYLVII